MNDKIEAKGKTVKEAVAEALLRLGARREEVIVKVVEEPKSGFLGLLGGRQAKVLVEKKRGGERSRNGGNRRGGGNAHSLSDDDGRPPRRARSSEQSGRRDGGDGRRSSARNETTDQKDGGGRQENKDASPRADQGDSRSGTRRRRRGSRGRGRGQRPAARTDSASPAGENGSNATAAPQQREPRARNPQAQAGQNDRNDRNDRDNRGNRAERDNRNDRGNRAERDNRDDRSAQNDQNDQNENHRNDRNRRNQRGRNRGNREQVVEPVTANVVEPVTANVVEPVTAKAIDNAPEPMRESAPPIAPETRENTSMVTDNPTPPQPDDVIREGLQVTAYAKPLRDVSEADRPSALEDLCGGMLLRAGFPNRCQVLDGEYLQVRVVTDDTSARMLIGRHGATVDSIEHIVERMISTAGGDRVKMNLDINNYRRRRQDTLADRVFDAVAKVNETGEDFHMEPMDARDRRLVHLQVEEAGGLTTETVIEGGLKHVVISRTGGESAKPVAEATGEAEMPAEESQPEA